MTQTWLIGAILLALFLGALDALVMSAAMPTIIAELSGLHLYAWVYSAYFLARAVALPIFGKLSDLFAVRRLLLISVTVFIAASMRPARPPHGVLVGARVFQGIGSGGIFALVYVVLSEAAPQDSGPKPCPWPRYLGSGIGDRPHHGRGDGQFFLAMDFSSTCPGPAVPGRYLPCF